MRKNSGFTLVEVLVSVMLAGIILTAAYSAFQGIMKSQVRLSGVIDIQKNLFYLNEKLSSLIHNGGTIDYEEYFNRRMLGYTRWFITPRSGVQIYTFSTLSKYGNGSGSSKPTVYVCGEDSSSNEDACLGNNAVWIKKPGDIPTFNTTLYDTTSPKQQWYGQYRELAFDYSTSLPNPIKLPSIYPDSTTPWTNFSSEGLPELYLIKKMPDGTFERTYFRHIFIGESSDSKNICDPAISTKNCLGKIQMTRMKSCDIFKADGASGADGIIDLWIPLTDFSSATTPTKCNTGIDFGKATNDLVWVDITTPDMDIVTATFLPAPEKIPQLMAGVGETSFSPTIQIHLEAKLSENIIHRGLLQGEPNIPHILMSTFDLSDV